MKSKLIIMLTAFLSVSLCSCVSTKKLTYLQEEEASLSSQWAIQALPQPYRIQVGDILYLSFKTQDRELAGMFQLPEENNQYATVAQRMYFEGYQVDVHGNIRIPVLGEVRVLDFSAEEIREDIENQLLHMYFKEAAELFVEVKLAGIRYTTIGEIGAGSHVIYKDQVSIMEAIAHAGDITRYGDRSKVVILRQYPGGTRRHYINLTQAEAIDSPFFQIQSNDLIIVNPIRQKAFSAGSPGTETFKTLGSIFTFFTTAVLLITNL